MYSIKKPKWFCFLFLYFYAASASVSEFLFQLSWKKEVRMLNKKVYKRVKMPFLCEFFIYFFFINLKDL